MAISHHADFAMFPFKISILRLFHGHLDMVGVVGSSPIAPTKQNPLCWAVWKGSPKGGPFFVVCDLQNFCKTFAKPPPQNANSAPTSTYSIVLSPCPSW